MESNPAKSMSALLKLNRVSLVVRLALVLFVVSCAVQVVGSLAGIFSYRDDKGAIHFTDDLSKIPNSTAKAKKGSASIVRLEVHTAPPQFLLLQ